MKIKTKVAGISTIVVIIVIFVFNSTVANLKIHYIPKILSLSDDETVMYINSQNRKLPWLQESSRLE